MVQLTQHVLYVHFSVATALSYQKLTRKTKKTLFLRIEREMMKIDGQNINHLIVELTRTLVFLC